MALKEATKEAIYLGGIYSYLNKELVLGYIYETPKILVDSSSAKKLAENPEFHKRTKHIEIIYHYTRAAIANEKIKIIQIPLGDQVADILTKNTTTNLHTKFKDLLNLVYIDI